MKAVRTESYESFDHYRMIDVPAPSPAAGEVRIAIEACGVGYVEALTARGLYQVKALLPFVPAGEVAGVIDALGAGVQGVSVGDRVMAYVAGGGFAEYGIAPAQGVTPMPAHMSFAEGAAFSVNFSTALFALETRAGLQAGERLLVIGAAGGTGVAAVQVGRCMGAEVIAVGSTAEKRAFALEHGAHAALDADREGWRERLRDVTGNRGVDVIFDPVCGPLFEPAFRSLGWRGRHLVVGFAGGGIPSLKANLTLMKGAALIGVDVRQFGLHEPEAARANRARILGWLNEGRIRSPHGRVFPFSEFREALTHAMSGKSIGKTILAVRG